MRKRSTMRLQMMMLGCLALSGAVAGCSELKTEMAADGQVGEQDGLDSRWTVGELLFADGFEDASLTDWRWELEQGGTVRVLDGKLDIEVPAGATIWLEQELEGPLLITYNAYAVDEGGPYDRVSDLNCFWMARDSRSPGDIFATERSGQFSGYNQLRCYYVGLGGNYNSTTRFRRYVGDPELRPLLPEHDLDDPEAMLKPNRWQAVQLAACGNLVQYYRDGRKLFELVDPAPYTSGWFGIRTTYSHLRIDDVRIYRLIPRSSH